MDKGITLLVYPVKDLAQAKTLYTKFLGVEPYMDSPYYVGFKVGDMEIGLDPNGQNRSAGAMGPIGYIEVTDVKQSLQSLLDAGAKLQQDARDVGGGMLVATVTDADGNIIGLRQSPAGA